MSSDSSRTAGRALRSPAPILVTALVFAWVLGIGPEARADAGSYFALYQTDAGIPAGALSHRGLDLQTGDDGRHRTAGPPRRGHRYGPLATDPATADSPSQPSLEPEGLATRALERAGRRSAPSTAPPSLS